MTTLTPAARAILDKPAFAFLATINPDGTPQVTPVWVDFEGDRLAFNTAEGRVKHRNMLRDPRITVSAHDPDDPYRWVTVHGTVEMTTEGGDEHIDRLAKKYLGKDTYPWRNQDETRVRVLVEPVRVLTS